MFESRLITSVEILCVALTLTACGEPVVESPDAATSTDALVDAVADTADGQATDVVGSDQIATDSGAPADAADSVAPVDGAGDATSTDDAGAAKCGADTDCSGPTPLCNIAQGVCVACKYAAHCPGPHGRCVAGQCLAPKSCVSDKTCSDDVGVCDPATKYCADCTNHADCGKGKVCKLSQCLPTPLDCKSSKDCAALNQVCDADGACVDCVKHADCKPGNACSSGLCVPAVCKPGATKCSGPIKREVCKDDGSGWEVLTCPSQTGCDAGVCKKQVCNPGQKKCDKGAPSLCSPSGLGWETTPCKSGEVCLAGVCTAKVCDAGKTQCTTDGKLQTCAADEKGWTTAACPAGESCDTGVCKEQICAPGEAYCDQEKKMICGPLGLSAKIGTDCGAAKGICAEGACAPTTCKAGDKLCKGADVAVCQADGKAWKVEPCPDADGNKCTAETCETATHTCKSGKPKPCDDGNVCTTGTCNGFTGDCKQAPKVGGCDDGDGCTVDDVCAAGACVKGAVKIVAWSGQAGAGFVDGPVAQARYSDPYDISAAADGSLVVADPGSRRIRRISVDGIVSTVAGSGAYGDIDGPGPLASFRAPLAVAAGKSGWIYVADISAHRIRVVDGAGTVSTLAGNGQAGDKDGPAASAQVYSPDSVAVDGDANVWFGESSRHRIRAVSAAGVVSSPLGSGAKGFADGTGSSAKLSNPYDVTVGPKGLIWFVDGANHRVRAFDPKKNMVETKIGTGVVGYLDGPALKAQLSGPRALSFGPAGRLWVLDYGNRLLRRLEADGTVTTVMGKKGVYGVTDGPLGTATLGDIRGVAFDHTGAALLVDRQYRRIRRIGRTQRWCDDHSSCTTDSCDAKSGECVYKPGKAGVSCDDGSACTTADACDAKGACAGKAKSCADANACTNDACNPYTGACLNAPGSAPCDDGDACTPADFCVDGACKADVGRILTFAGNGSGASAPGKGSLASLNRPYGLARAKSGVLYVSERYGHRLSQVATDGTVSAFAGAGDAGFLDGPAAKAKFNHPTGLAADPFGSVYVADTANNRVRVVNALGVVSTLAGSGSAGHADGKATVAKFNQPLGLDIDGKGVVWVADTLNHQLRRIDTAGVVTTVAGEGAAGFSDGVGKYVRFHTPSDVVVMADGALLVADTFNHRLRRVASTGATSTWAGLGGTGFDEGHRNNVRLYYPAGLAAAADGSIYLSTTQNSEIRVVAPNGIVRKLVGGSSGFSDGMLPVARLYGPVGMVAATSASLYVADQNNGRVRQVLRPAVTCTAGSACAPEVCDIKTGSCAVKPIAEGGSCLPGVCQVGGVCKAKVCTGGKANPCDDKKPCTKDSCNAKTGACEHEHDASVAGCCTESIYGEGFETDAPKWLLESASHDVAWHAWAPKDASYTVAGKKVLKMGLAGDAKMTKLPASYVYKYATSETFIVPKGVASTLDFQYRFDLAATSSHRLYFYLQVDQGPSVLAGVQYGTSVKAWQKWSYDLSGFGGRKVRVRLRGRIYGPAASGHGILIDDLAVTSICKKKACTAPSQCITNFPCYKSACTAGACTYTDSCCASSLVCDDGKPCTYDSCHATSGCQHQAVGDCCATAKDDATKACDDNNACTADLCPSAGGTCLHNEIKGCCLFGGDCDDGKDCTIDTCDATKHTCTHKDICCTTDKQCDDGDDTCTTDKCVAGKCAYTYATVASCCVPTIASYDFNAANQAAGWALSSCSASSAAYLPTNCKSAAMPSPGKGWQIWAASPVYVSPKGTLYYGDPKTSNYAFGASAQTVRSPAMKVQSGTSTLKFKVNYQTENGITYDRLVAFLWVDGKRITTSTGKPAGGAAWYKGQSGYTTPNVWKSVAIDVSKYVGKSLQVEFYFNTVDGASNNGKGVFIDDLRLDSTCK